MAFDLKEYAERRREEALRELSRQEGMEEAYRDIATHLDPEACCQDCGQVYDESHNRILPEMACKARKDRLRG